MWLDRQPLISVLGLLLAIARLPQQFCPVLQIADLLLVPLSLACHHCFQCSKFSHSLPQLRKLLFQIRQVLIHLLAAMPLLRHQTRNLSPDPVSLSAPVCNGYAQTCDMWFGSRDTVLRLRPSQCRLPPLQNPPLHSIFDSA
jgi:hypothetical protein